MAALALLLSGCASELGPAYYWQAVQGQWSVWQRARPVDEVLADPAVPEALRQRLVLAGEMRRFASHELGLPDNASYRSYADLGRSAVVWNVFAAPALSLEARQWCFPVAGCVGYLGYFSEAAARERAEALRREGLDVHVGAVPAYSTLGWLNDPLLNTFVGWRESALAGLIFHELAHQQLYVPDDTEFNESFASAVERLGVRRWLAQAGKEAERAAFERALPRQQAFAALVQGARREFVALYDEAARAQAGAAPALPASHFVTRKALLLAQLQADYRQLRDTQWGGDPAYDAWFEGVNNASLASVGFYQTLVPGFEALLAREEGDLTRWYARVAELAALPPEARRARLAEALR